jgi:hypothetical protein
LEAWNNLTDKKWTPRERTLLVIVGTFLIFLWLNFNPELGSVYLGMVLLSFTIFSSDKIVSIYAEKQGSSWFFSFILAVAAYAFFVMTSGILIGVITPSYVAQNEGVFSMVARTMAAATPAMAGSFILTFISWAVIAAIVETDFFFGKLLEWCHDAFKLPVEFNLVKLKAWIVIIALSFVFALFHISVKGVSNNQSLLLTFWFAVISMWLVLRVKETKAAIMFHMLSNGVAVLKISGFI